MSIMQKDSLKFLKDLSANNNRDWFHANKKRYETSLKKPFYELIEAVIVALNKAGHQIELQPKDMVFRINRDIRFSKDKSPYKTNVGALISEYGRKRKDLPGYYLHIEQGILMVGGGAYFLDTQNLYTVRQHIANNLSRFTKLLKAKSFKDKFETIKGDAHKRVPKEFVEVHEKLPLILNKQFYFMAELDPKLVLKDDAVKLIVQHLKAGKPINDFFLEALL